MEKEKRSSRDDEAEKNRSLIFTRIKEEAATKIFLRHNLFVYAPLLHQIFFVPFKSEFHGFQKIGFVSDM